jgi:hypothetical protein
MQGDASVMHTSVWVKLATRPRFQPRRALPPFVVGRGSHSDGSKRPWPDWAFIFPA